MINFMLSLKRSFCSNLVSEQARSNMMRFWSWLRGEDGQDVAEYAIMLAVVLAVVVGTIRLIGSGANNVFSSVGSSIQ
jgi:Flp pilus assembly pilin Flp